MTRPLFYLLAVAMTAALACAGDESPGEQVPLSVWASSDAEEANMAADLRGTVEVDLDAGCVWLRSGEGLRYSVVWPAGTNVTLDPVTLHFDSVAGGEIAREGDLLFGGGGIVSRGHVSVRDLATTRNIACDEQQQIVVFNRYSRIDVTPSAQTD